MGASQHKKQDRRKEGEKVGLCTKTPFWMHVPRRMLKMSAGTKQKAAPLVEGETRSRKEAAEEASQIEKGGEGGGGVF